jgi:hypothetical protein
MKIKQQSNLTSGSFITSAYAAWLARLAGQPARGANQDQPVASRTFYSWWESLTGTSQSKALADRIKLGLAVAVLATLTGCIGVVGGGGGWWGGGWWGGEGGWWGGHDRGGDVHAFSARGAASRGAAHGGGGRH